jgi:hypothetical protein
MNRFNEYTENLDSHIQRAFKDQQKTVKRREVELSNELDELR